MEPTSHAPNNANPESLGGTVLAVNIACCTIATVFTAIRLFVRIKILHSTGWDDLAAALATIMFNVICIVSCITVTNYGFGKHIRDIDPKLRTPQLKLALVITCLYNPTMTAIKLSILFFYLRIFSSPTFRKFVFGMIAFTVAMAVSFTLANLLRCAPIAFYWDRSIPGGSCINVELFLYLNASFSIITDLMIWALPIPILKNLDLNRRKKYALLFVFSLGLFACIASILRLRVLRYVRVFTDSTWSNVGINTWSQIEMATSITCACLPPLKPLLSRIFRGIFDSHRGTYVNSNNSRIHNSQDVYALQEITKGSGSTKSPLVPKESEEEMLGRIEASFAIDIESVVTEHAVSATTDTKRRPSKC